MCQGLRTKEGRGSVAREVTRRQKCVACSSRYGLWLLLCRERELRVDWSKRDQIWLHLNRIPLVAVL